MITRHQKSQDYAGRKCLLNEQVAPSIPRQVCSSILVPRARATWVGRISKGNFSLSGRRTCDNREKDSGSYLKLGKNYQVWCGQFSKCGFSIRGYFERRQRMYHGNGFYQIPFTHYIPRYYWVLYSHHLF